jgi:hypothetical protein
MWRNSLHVLESKDRFLREYLIIILDQEYLLTPLYRKISITYYLLILTSSSSQVPSEDVLAISGNPTTQPPTHSSILLFNIVMPEAYQLQW